MAGKGREDGDRPEAGQQADSRGVFSCTRPGGLPRRGVLEGPELPERSGHQASQEGHGGRVVSIEEEMNQPCKEGQPEQAAANEDREKQVVAFIDNPEDVLVDTEEEEEE